MFKCLLSTESYLVVVVVVGTFNKENAFSGHCEILRSPIDSSTRILSITNLLMCCFQWLQILTLILEKIPLWLAADGDGEAGAQN